MSKVSFRMVIEARFRSSHGTVLTGKVISGEFEKGDYVRLFTNDMKVVCSAKIIGFDMTIDSSQHQASILVDEASVFNIAEKGMVLFGVPRNEIDLFAKPFKMNIIDIFMNRPRYMHLYGEVIQGRIYSGTPLKLVRADNTIFSFHHYTIIKSMNEFDEPYADLGEIINIASKQIFPDVKRTDFVIIDEASENHK